MTMTKKLFAALALTAAVSTVGAAQTDFGSSLGAGAGVGGAVAPLGLPGGNGGGSGGISGAGAQGLANARAAFMNATGGGVNVTNPSGGSVVLPQAAAQALGAVLGGSPTAAQSSALATAFGPAPAAQANALVTALAALGSNASFGALVNAVQAYNAAIDALPAGANPSPALLAARQALFAASR